MRQMDEDAQAEKFKEHCYTLAKTICKEHSVYEELIESFQEWVHNYCIDDSDFVREISSNNNKDLIDDWWEEKGEDLVDADWTTPYDIDPTPQYLYDDSGGEPPVSAEEYARNSLDSKRESHGHRYYSSNW